MVKALAVATVVVAVLAGPSAPVSATPAGDTVDQKMQKALDPVYQRDLPGWDETGDGLVLGGGGGGGSGGRVNPNGSGGGSSGPSSGSAGGVHPGSGGLGSGGAGSGGLGSGGSGGSDPLGMTPGSGSAGTGSAGSGVDPDTGDGSARVPNGTPGDPRTHHPAGRGDRGHGHSGTVGSGDAGPLGGIATVLLWGVVVILAILLILAIVRGTSGVTGEEAPVQTADDDDADDPARLLAVIEKPRDDADQLAHEGKFADAIHTLLLRTLHELASQNMVRITQAMTSREVLARVPLLGDSRTALAGLVAAVEVTWFGDDVPGPADYTRCREQFELFAVAYRRGAHGQQRPAPAPHGARA